ncbi:MAG: hypothetical protein H6718_07775 [Polyangiaceae bacterium]|nr:hypothetical protein [Polyangiaceae bacterium]MCB9606703.1 hypothetical protein [Polyangiaceae bacterium]
MKTVRKEHSAATKKRLTTLGSRAQALEAVFACGGEVELASPLVLGGKGRKRLQIVDRFDIGRPKAGKRLYAWCAPASFGEGKTTRQDARVREGGQLYARDGALTVEGFDGALRQILSEIHKSLCPHDSAPPNAHLHSLNVYRHGGHFVAHKDTPRDPGVLGTLVVCLPLHFSGGRLIIGQESTTTFDWQTRAYFGSSPIADGLRVRWAAFFGDVDHRIETVTSGIRATLTYELRRAQDSRDVLPKNGGDPEAAFATALAEAIADPRFVPDGAKLGIPCIHLYAVPTTEGGWPGMESLCDHLKGRDRGVAVALESVGLLPRVVPYVFETCGGESWRLRRQANAREKQIFSQKRLKGSSLERRLPIEFHAEWDNPDDVTWLARPPWVSTYREIPDGRPEPAVELLGETEYSATNYFGNESSDAAFYAAAAILFEVPPKSARKRKK